VQQRKSGFVYILLSSILLNCRLIFVVLHIYFTVLTNCIKWYTHRSSSSSSSRDSSTDSASSSDSNGKAIKRQKVWVERTKETIFGSSEDKKTNGLKHPTAAKERSSSSNVAEELRKMSHSGYGGSQGTFTGHQQKYPT
jgi:hypothetical protein